MSLEANTFTAVAHDALGRSATNTVNWVADWDYSNPLVPAYDANGNLITNGSQVLSYDDENQLINITKAGAWKSDFTYDGKMRRRERYESVWNGSAWVTNLITRAALSTRRAQKQIPIS